ncbi:MAG TPA: hypothetical protein VF103_04425 [Polyangiaceae bacterium]
MPGTEFVVHLAKGTYQSKIGWACQALALPSAEVTSLVVGGRKLRAEEFLVRAGHVRLADGIMADDAFATISVPRRLALRSSVVVAVATAVFAIAAVTAAHYSTPEHACEGSR